MKLVLLYRTVLIFNGCINDVKIKVISSISLHFVFIVDYLSLGMTAVVDSLNNIATVLVIFF